MPDCGCCQVIGNRGIEKPAPLPALNIEMRDVVQRSDHTPVWFVSATLSSWIDVKTDTPIGFHSQLAIALYKLNTQCSTKGILNLNYGVSPMGFEMNNKTGWIDIF